MVHGYYFETEPIVLSLLKEKGIHFFYFCAGRGVGKTYSSLDMCVRLARGEIKIDSKTEDEKFLYLRRTGVEAQSIASYEACPFKAYNRNEGTLIKGTFKQSLGFGEFYEESSEEKKHIGYASALSTFANLRGVDFSDVTLVIYDECIPESKNKRPLKNEGMLLLNMLETINRNRLMEGREEVVLIMLSNPIDLSSDLLSQLGFTPILNNMIIKNRSKFTDKNRSLHIEKLVDLKVSDDKKSSVLYKFAGDTGFTERSLSGDFCDNDMSVIKSVNLSEYTCELSLENLYVYKHKSKDLWYITTVRNTPKYSFKVSDREKFRTTFYWRYKLLVASSCMFYDNYATRTIFNNMIKYKDF